MKKSAVIWAMAAIVVAVLGAASPAQAALVSQWKLDNDATDSVGTNNGTMVNGATFSTDFDV